MLIFKRTITAIFAFIVLYFIFWFAILIIGGAIAGGIAGAQNPENARLAGEIAGRQFAQKYLTVIMISSIVLSGVCSFILTFGGILPWCRKSQ